MRTVRRAATPRTVKQAGRMMHPVSNTIYSAERSLNTKPRKTAAPAAPAAPVRTTEAANQDWARWGFIVGAMIPLVVVLVLFVASGSLPLVVGGAIGTVLGWKATRTS